MDKIFSSDRPQINPSTDRYGYAPFAKILVDSLCGYTETDGLVVGLYGAWGSGKSTILNFIRHYINEIPDSNRPIVVEFNPWWFSSQENLAITFLRQLQAILPQKSANFDKLRTLLGELAIGIGGLLDLTGVSGGLGEKAGTLAKNYIEPPKKDILTLKDEICTILEQSPQRIIIMIDDIDRLDVGEILQLFTAVKAVADFPNVIYVLAFDESVVARAIDKYNIPSQEYLEKIIQVPFSMPHVDRGTLLQVLYNRLIKIIEKTPQHLISQDRFSSIFYSGIENFFKVPRDIVRFCNTLSVTYPGVLGEVNAVDFIAIEAIRVFLPNLYKYIQSNGHIFISPTPLSQKDRDGLMEKIKTLLPKDIYNSVERILMSIFPSIRGNSIDISSSRKLSLICCSEFFYNYFRFSSTPGIIPNTEILRLLANIGDTKLLSDTLISVKREGGSKLHQLLDRLRDYAEDHITEKDIPNIINVLFDIGDELLDIPSEKQALQLKNNEFLIYALLEILGLRLPLQSRLSCIESAMISGHSLIVPYRVLSESERTVKNGRDSLLPIEELPKFKELWMKKVYDLVANGELLSHPYLNRVLSYWNYIGADIEQLRSWCMNNTKSDSDMFEFIKKFINFIRADAGDRIQYISFVDPRDFENFIDIQDFESRILSMQESGRIPPEYDEVAILFLKGVSLLRAGLDPHDFLNYIAD